jgi:SAM-dependent methyltransferase
MRIGEFAVVDRILHQFSHVFGAGAMTAQDFRQTMACYSALPLRNRIQIWARLLCLPPILKAVDEYIPTTSNRLLDLGCGYGLVSLLLGNRRKQEIVGIEASPSRFSIAQQATEGIEHVTIQHGNIVDAAIPLSDGVLLIDVLCLFPDDIQQRILIKCASALADSGILLLKDNTTIPKWKYRYTHFEERIKLLLNAYGTRTLKQPNYRSPEAWHGLITGAGLEIRGQIFMKSLAPYPGIIYVCQKRPERTSP